MATEELLKKLAGLLDAKKSKQKKKYDNIKKLLKKLKQRQLYYKEQLKNELDPDERDRIARTLEVIKVQRKKGIRLCKELKNQK